MFSAQFSQYVPPQFPEVKTPPPWDESVSGPLNLKEVVLSQFTQMLTLFSHYYTPAKQYVTI